MKTKKYNNLALLVCILCNVGFLYGQTGIGKRMPSPVAQLDLNTTNKALVLPRMGVSVNNSTSSPVQSPAKGLLLYNTAATNISQNIKGGVTYWGVDNKYQTVASIDGIEDLLEDTHIPLLIFSASADTKPNVSTGSSGGGTITKLTLAGAEIFVDNYGGWVTINRYNIAQTGKYIIEYSTVIANTADGTSAVYMYLNGNINGSSLGRWLNSVDRAYATFSNVVFLNAGDYLEFYYIYTQNNYTLQQGSALNIYRF